MYLIYVIIMNYILVNIKKQKKELTELKSRKKFY